MLTRDPQVGSRAQQIVPGHEKQKMRAEQPFRTQASEFQTEPCSASYGLKTFWSPASKSVLGQTWPGPRVGLNLAGARFCSTQATLRGSRKSLRRLLDPSISGRFSTRAELRGSNEGQIQAWGMGSGRVWLCLQHARPAQKL